MTKNETIETASGALLAMTIRMVAERGNTNWTIAALKLTIISKVKAMMPMMCLPAG